jgi:hypothetical protein
MDLCKLTRHSSTPISFVDCLLPTLHCCSRWSMERWICYCLLATATIHIYHCDHVENQFKHLGHTHPTLASLKLKHETPYTQNWKKVSPFLKLGNIPQIPPAISTYCAKHTWWCQQCQTPTAQSQNCFKRIVNSPAHLWICETIILQAKETRWCEGTG